jgi:hypothetical protein
MRADFASADALQSAAGTDPLELCFGGIWFSFLGAPELLEYVARGAELPDRPQAVRPDPKSRIFARVRCRLAPAAIPELPGSPHGPETRTVSYERREGAEHAFAWGANAEILGGDGEYSADVNLAPSHRAARNLLALLAYALVRQAGGAVLHAASVELPEGVVAFVGPSGAGKSTACLHVDGAQFFAADRLAVVPTAGSAWSAHPLPGGTPLTAPMPVSTSAGRSLRAVLRIRQAREGCWFEPCRGTQAVALLRESTFRTAQTPQPEAELLSQLERLAGATSVGKLHFSLGTALGAVLRGWLSDGTLGGRARKDFAAGASEATPPVTGNGSNG